MSHFLPRILSLTITSLKSFVRPTPAPTVSKLPTYDAGCFDFSLSFLLPKVIDHGLYYSWSVTSLDHEGVYWGENSAFVLPDGKLSNSIVTKRPLDDRVCLPVDSSYELQINIHGSHPASETVKGTACGLSCQQAKNTFLVANLRTHQKMPKFLHHYT